MKNTNNAGKGNDYYTEYLNAVKDKKNEELFKETKETREFYIKLKKDLTIPLEYYKKPITL